MMIESSLSSSKSKLELKLIGPQSSRNQLRQSNNQLVGSQGGSTQNNTNFGCNTSRTPLNVTPKRQNSNHNGMSISNNTNNNNNNHLNTCANLSNYAASLAATSSQQLQGSLNAQINSRLQGTSYLNKGTHASNISKLNNQNFTKKSSGIYSNQSAQTAAAITTTTTSKSTLNSGSTGGYGSGSVNQQSISNNIGGGSFSQDKMNSVMKNNFSRQKNNSNMHMTHKNQILQQYQTTKQQIQQQQVLYQQQVMQYQHQSLLHQQSIQNQSSMHQIHDLTSSPSPTHIPPPHLSPSTSQSHIPSNDLTTIKNSYLNKANAHSYLNNQEVNGKTSPYQKYLQPNLKSTQDSSSYYGSSSGNGTAAQSSASIQSKSKFLTPINEKNKQGQQQNSYLKKSQLIVTKNQNNSNQLNTSSNNASFLKQSHSRSPLSTTNNHIDKENTYLNHFEVSNTSLIEKSKRTSQIHSQTSQSQSNIQSSPFSYLSSGQTSSHLNNLSTMSNNGKQKSSKSPKQSNSLQMVTSSLETPAGNFFSSHLNRKKNLSTVNNYNSFSSAMDKQSAQLTQNNQLSQQSYSINTQNNFDQSPISNTRRFNQLDHNQSNDMNQTNQQNSFLQSSNLKDHNSEYQNKTQDYGILGKNSGFLSNYPNSSRLDQYRSVETENRSSSRNFFPKTYLNIDTKESQGNLTLKKNNDNLDGVDLLSGINCSKFGGLVNTDNKFITQNEQELSFQNDQDENIMMLMNQQNKQNMTQNPQGNSYCYGYYNEDESNFLNSTNFLNLTNLQINNTQSNAIISGGNTNTNNNNNNNNNQKNLSTNTSQILQQNMNGNGNNMQYQYQSGMNNNNNNNSSVHQNMLNNTLNWTNSTNLFNNSVCAGSMMNTTINNILQNMNSTQSTSAYTMNNTISTTANPPNNNNMNNNNFGNHSKMPTNIYSSLTQANQTNPNSTSNPNHTNAHNTPTSINAGTQPSSNTNILNGNANQNFSSATSGYGINQVCVAGNNNTDKLPLDTTPKQVSLFPDPTPSKNVCTSLKSILYDHIMPTIKPITRQFKLLNSHQVNNSYGNAQNLLINPNFFGNEQISNQNKQQILQQLTKQFSSSCINNTNSNTNNNNNNNSNANNINSTNDVNNNNNNNSSNNMNNIENMNITSNVSDKNQFDNSNNFNAFGYCLNQNNTAFTNNFDEQKTKFQQISQNDNSYGAHAHQSSNFFENKSQLVESISSNQTTPIKMHLKIDQHSMNSFNNNNTYYAGKDTPVLKSPYSRSKDEYISTPSPKLQAPNSANNINKQGQSNQNLSVSGEKDQIALQQYNFSFSNCVNQQKKLHQQQQQQQSQLQSQQQNSIQDNKNNISHHQDKNEDNISQNKNTSWNQISQQNYQFLHESPQKKAIQENNKHKSENNMLIYQDHKLVESMQQDQLTTSPDKPVINLLISQQITVVDGIAQVSSQMFQGDQPIEFSGSPFVDQCFVQNNWSIDSFQIGKCLGRGRFGNVYLSRHKLTNMLFAIKQINKKNLIESCMEKQLQQEIKIQTYLNHPNVLKMHGFFDDRQKIYLILELASHGDIYKEIKRENQKKFTEEKAANYIRQVCEGLIYLHSQGIIHRDIKPENILNSYGVLKLSDFGWSIYTEEKRMTFCGTLDYVSPEVVSGKDYDFKVDIWSIGVLTYELITGKPPFENRQNHNEAYQKILMVKYDFPTYISKDAKDFMSKLLVGDPNKRISLETALNHDWILKNTRNCLADWDPKVSEESLYLLK